MKMHSSQKIEAIITQERKRQKMSLRELEKLTGIPKSTLSRYENGSRKFPTNKVDIFAKALHLDPLELLGISDYVVSIDKLVKIPVIKKITCQTSILSPQNIVSYQYMSQALIKPNMTNLFFFKCREHAMQPTIPAGSLVLIHQQSCIKDNEIAMLLINGKMMLRRIKYVDKQILLITDNQAYSPIIFHKNANNRLLGKAMQVLSYL